MTEVLNTQELERLREAGYVVVPLRATDEMKKIGAPICYQTYDGDWDVACSDASDCYAAMIAVGAL